MLQRNSKSLSLKIENCIRDSKKKKYTEKADKLSKFIPFNRLKCSTETPHHNDFDPNVCNGKKLVV